MVAYGKSTLYLLTCPAKSLIIIVHRRIMDKGQEVTIQQS